ncbi:sulfite exporter TauE/SafE family protein [Candidatus Woesearchaeota archaeon]|nr:sulfite exporter TauE/SafE family protein [Candidatus Woesearchaeota archaeon]
MNLIEDIELVLGALIASLFGQGGGVLYTPIQLWNGSDFHQAASISLFLIVVTSFTATIVYRKSNKVDWILALLFELPTALGAFVGGYASHFVSSTSLRYLLSGLLLIAAYFLFFPPKERQKKVLNTKSLFWVIQHKKNGLIYSIDIRLMVPIMFVVGALTGMIGIGGGILKVPIMLIIFNIPMSIAVGSSAFMVGITAAGGLLGHLSHGNFDWHSALILVIPVTIGALAGSMISVKLHSARLIKYFGVFLFLLAILMAGQTFFK